MDGMGGVPQDRLRQAEAACGLHWAFTGKLGKRLRYQTIDVAQLVVETTSTPPLVSPAPDLRDPPPRDATAAAAPGPGLRELPLHDAERLDGIRFAEAAPQTADAAGGALSALEQSLLLAWAYEMHASAGRGAVCADVPPCRRRCAVLDGLQGASACQCSARRSHTGTR